MGENNYFEKTVLAMVVVLKKGASREEIEKLRIKLALKKPAGVDTKKYCGVLKLKEDPLIIQKKCVMNGNSYVLDTNAMRYILNGDENLTELLFGAVLYVCVNTEIELLSYRLLTDYEDQQIKNFLSEFKLLD